MADSKDSHQNNASDAFLKDSQNLKIQYDQSDNQSGGSLQGKREQLNEGRWSEEDNLRFVVFIHKHQEIFNSKHQRKSCKIFKLFSEHLLNRTPSQCRSHFQKFMIKFKTIAKLKRFYRKKFGDQLYNSEMERLTQCTSLSNKSAEQLVTWKTRKEFGVQTESFQNKDLLMGVPVAEQNAGFVNFVDYQEYMKNMRINLQRLSEVYYWPCYCVNNPQFV